MKKRKESIKALRYPDLASKALNSFPDFFTDVELIELLLYPVLNKKNVKLIANKLYLKFGDLNSLVNVTDDSFKIKNADDKKILSVLLVIKEMLKRTLIKKVANQNILTSFDGLVDYLKFTMMSVRIEQLRIIYLNKRNILITDEVLSMGTIDELPVFPREILKRALFHEASAIIIVHNHPSGSTKPSQKDIKITSRIVNACNSINIKVLDHVIISKGEYFSFKDNIVEWEKISEEYRD